MPRKRVSKLNSPALKRNIALCYVRQSFTRDGNDKDSPERQRANIAAVCERNGWTPEWHEDVEGHKSGTKEQNRPGWLGLKSRLGDPDVVTLVANDLSRLHRKGWRVGDLIDYLDQHNVTLVLAAPGREIDLSTPMGRLFVQFSAIMDEWYAADIAQRAKDSIAYRKAQGKTIGAPPFGTVRDQNGFLVKSPEGAWLLPNGRFAAGTADFAPDKHAVWRSYAACAEYILTLFRQGNIGLEKIAYKLNEEGWPFRDRTGAPRRIHREDIRRVVGNWPEYGGLVLGRKAKERPGYEDLEVDTLPLDPQRAVFDLRLLKDVAQVRAARSIKPIDQSRKRSAYPYPLSVITYCAHCEQLAAEHGEASLRTTFSGRTDIDGTRRYRHKRGVVCGCTNQSVACTIYEADFSRLIKLLTIRPESLDLMTELAIQANRHGTSDSDVDLEAEKQAAIALCRRRIDAAVNLYGDGMIDYDEYVRRVEANRREIAHWESRTTETEKAAYELAMCTEAVDRIARLWDISDDEDRQGLARSLFDYVVYNLDTQRITDFRLKGWADRFLVLRAKLYEDDTLGIEGRNQNSPTDQGLGNDMPHTGFEPVFWP